MLAAIFVVDLLLVLLLVAGLGVVIWAIVDVAQRPTITPGAKAGWIIGLVLGTLLFGIVGVVVAVVYLAAFRPRLMRGG